MFVDRSWPDRIATGLRVAAWFTLVGRIGANAIASAIPLLGGTAELLWITRIWGVVFEFAAVVGIMLATAHPPSRGGLVAVEFVPTAVRMLAIAAVLARVSAMLVLSLRLEAEWIYVVFPICYTVRDAAFALFVWHVASLMRRFGALRLEFVLKWATAALVLQWLIDYPGDALVMTVVDRDSVVAWTYTIVAMVYGSVLLIGVCVSLLYAAKVFPGIAVDRCENCGYFVHAMSRCPECGATWAVPMSSTGRASARPPPGPS